MNNNPENSPSENPDRGPATETIRGGPPPGATVFERRKRVLDTVRWGSIAVFLVIALLVGFHILWLRTHVRPVIDLTPGLLITNDGLANLADLGLDRAYQLVEVQGRSISSYREYADAIDSSDEPFVRFRAADPNDADRIETFAYRDVPAYPRLEQTDQLEVESVEGFDLETLGVPPGTRLTHVEGQPVSSREQWNEKISGDLGRIVRLTLQPPPGEGPPLQVVFKAMLPWNVVYVLFVVGLVIGILGCAVFWLKPDARSSWGFLFFSLHIGLFWLFRSVPFEYRLLVERVPYFLLICFAPFTTIAFLLTFSPIRLTIRRPSRFAVAGAVFGVGLIGAEWLLDPQFFKSLSLSSATLPVWALAMLSLALVTLPIDFWFRLRNIPLGATDRARARVIRLATLFGFVPVNLYTLYWLQTHVSTQAATNNVRVVFELSVLLFPIIIAYAVIRHNLLRIDELLHETLVYGLLLGGLGTVFMLITGAAVPLVETIAPGSGGFLQPVLIAGASLAVLPVHHRLRSTMAVRFHRAGLDLEDLDRIVDETGQAAASAKDFTRRLIQSLGAPTGATSVTLLLYHPGRRVWSMGAASPEIVSDGWQERGRPVLEAITSRGQPIHRDKVLEQLESDHARWEMIDALRALGAAIVFPLVAQGRVLGALAIGDRRDNRNYTKDDLSALARVARHIAFILSKLVSHQVAARDARIVDLYPDYPATIGRYQIQEFVGEGGMAYVYRGRFDGRDYAIKVANRAVQDDPVLVERFQREAHAMKQLNHPNIAEIHEVGTVGDEPYIVIDYFTEGTLADYLKRNPNLDEAAALEIAIQAARGLQAAFERGIIHRDIKPKNLFVSSDGELKIGDFGLAHVTGESTITISGQIFGTPQYMAPEIFQGQRATRATDEYALGVTFFEMLAGRRPFSGETMEALIYAHLHSPVPDVRRVRKDIGEDTARLIKRMMAKDPQRRFSSYLEIIDKLSSIISPDRSL